MPKELIERKKRKIELKKSVLKEIDKAMKEGNYLKVLALETRYRIEKEYPFIKRNK